MRGLLVVMDAPAVCLAGVAFGRAPARDASPLDAAVAGAVVVTLLASPHLFHHDLALLTPTVVWGCASAERLDGERWPDRRTRVVLAVWVAFVAIAFEQLSAPLVGFPGRLVPWLLMLMGALAAGAARELRDKTTAVQQTTDLLPAGG